MPQPRVPQPRTLALAVLASLVLVLGAAVVMRAVKAPASRAGRGPGFRPEFTAATNGLAHPSPTHPPVRMPTEPGVPTPAPAIQLLRSEPPTRNLADLAVRMGRLTAPAADTAERPGGAYSVGDSERFWVHDIRAERYFSITATLELVTDEAYFWVQDGQTFDREALRSGAEDFSSQVLPAVRDQFGREWSPGIDGDPRLHVLHHEYIGGIAGYFSSADEHTTPVEPHSNEREMFYINLGTYEPGSFDYLALLAHEMQHMIHWRHDRDEPVWMNEGLSDLAALVAGYQVQTGNLFTRDPDVALLEWEPDTGANGPHYAASFLFVAYLRAQYGDEVIRQIVAAPANGPSGVEQALAAVGAPRSFDEVFMDWVVANRVDDAMLAGGRYGYAEMAIDRVRPAALEPSGVEAAVNQYATDYYDVTGLVSDGRLALEFAGDSTVGLLQSVPAAEGMVWWSNRGDTADSRLTRLLDLTAARQASLQLRMWYELEENWDYAYFLVSTDNGATWSRLATDITTASNPNGNNYGNGLTGTSGGWVTEIIDLTPFVGSEVLVRLETVTDEAVSLSGLAVDDIALRTWSGAGNGTRNPAGSGSDAASSSGSATRARAGSGTPDLTFFDDSESDTGWQAEGWLRLDPRLQQRWGLQVIVSGPDVLTVRRVSVAPDGTAAVTVDDVPGDAWVTLAVSALTPGTRNPAGYRLRAAPRAPALP